MNLSLSKMINRRTTVQYVSCCILNIFVISLSRGNILRRRAQEDRSGLLYNSSRPKIFTFFSPENVHVNSSLPDENKLILDAWKLSWSRRGWEPVFLTMEDAKLHNSYDRFKKAFEDATMKISYYDQYCFYRWLAVAAHGGGWMSDFDNFPLYFDPNVYGYDLPHGGKFTSYDGHVPNLVSGSLEEWNAMIDLLYESYQKNNHRYWSDMFALIEIHKELDAYLYIFETTSPKRLYFREIKMKYDIDPYDLGSKCVQLIGIKTIHFSHGDCEFVKFCDYKRHLAYYWVKKWERKCL